MAQQDIIVIEPDVIGDEVRECTDSKGEKCTVIIKDTIIKKGNQKKQVVIDAKILGLIEGMASAGSNNTTIAKVLNIDEQIFKSLVDRKTKVYEAVERGKARGIDIVNKAFFVAAAKGNSPAVTLAWLSKQEDAADRPRIINKDKQLELVSRLSVGEALEKYYDQNKLMTDLDKRSTSIEDREQAFERLFYGKDNKPE